MMSAPGPIKLEQDMLMLSRPNGPPHLDRTADKRGGWLWMGNPWMTCYGFNEKSSVLSVPSAS